jgi:hypothetical protein
MPTQVHQPGGRGLQVIGCSLPCVASSHPPIGPPPPPPHSPHTATDIRPVTPHSNCQELPPVQALELAEDPDHGATGGIDYPLKVRE